MKSVALFVKGDRSTLKQLLGRTNAACQTVCKQQAGNGQENTAQEANEIKSDLCVQLLRLSPRNLSKFAIRKTASMRMTFHCILAFMYNILLLNNNLYTNGEKDKLGAIMKVVL